MVKPILASAGTSILMFLLLLFSGIEILKQVSIFCASGLVFASLSALFAAPFIFDNKPIADIKLRRHCGFLIRHCGLDPQSPTTNEIAGQARNDENGARFKASIIVAIIFIATIASAPFVQINLDVESLNTNTQQLETDQKNFAALTGNAYTKNQLFFVCGKTRDEVLRNNEIISKQNNDALAMSSLFPSQTTKENNKIQWENFWQPRKPYIANSLNAVLKKYLLDPALFKDFFDFMSAPDAGNADFDLTSIYNPIIEYKGEYAFVNIIPINAKLRSNRMIKTLSISNISIQEKAAKSVLTRFAIIVPAIFLCSFIVLILIFKKIKLAFIAILAPLCSIAVLFIIAALLQIEINLFGLFAIPLIVGLGIDYGMFMVFQSIGSKDLHPTKAVFLAALSTLIGFGSLMIAQHKVLFNIGFIVFVGILSTILISIFIIPVFLKEKGN
jgi:predicted exporter